MKNEKNYAGFSYYKNIANFEAFWWEKMLAKTSYFWGVMRLTVLNDAKKVNFANTYKVCKVLLT